MRKRNTTYAMIRVGHTAYTGANAFKAHYKYCTALWDLLSRRVAMKDAHRALKAAIDDGSHATCSTFKKLPSGNKVALCTIEVVATWKTW